MYYVLNDSIIQLSLWVSDFPPVLWMTSYLQISYATYHVKLSTELLATLC